jgi:hypothetical protein
MTKKYFDQLNSGSEVVSMRQNSAYVYENVMKISSHIIEENSREAMLIYQKVFIERLLKIILDFSSSNKSEQFSV